MIFDTKKLGYAIKHCAYVVANKSMLPSIKYISLKVSNGRVWLTGTNLNTTVIVAYDNDTNDLSESLECLIDKSIVSYFSNFDIVDISINSGKVTFNFMQQIILTMSLPPIEDFYEIDKTDIVNIFDGNETLLSYIAKTVPFCTSDEMRPAMTGINIVSKDNIEICASDGHVLICTDTGLKAKQNFDIVITKQTGTILSKIKNANITTVSKTNTHCFIKILSSDFDITVIGRLISQKYPDFRAVIPAKEININKYVISKSELERTLKMCVIYCGGAVNTYVILSHNLIHAKRLYKNDDAEYKAVVNMEIIGKPEQTQFNVSILNKAISAFKQDQIILNYSLPSKPCTIHDGNTLLLIMPVIIY